MPAATSREGLLTITHIEYDKLCRVLQKVDTHLALEPDDDSVSIKDTVAHRAHWIHLFIGWYRDGLAGEPVHFPAPGYKWSDLRRYNAELRSRQRDLGWDQALDALGTAHAALVSFIEDRSDEDLYGAPMVGANNEWTPGRWAEAAGPSHYRSAAKYVRARVRAASQPAPDSRLTGCDP